MKNLQIWILQRSPEDTGSSFWPENPQVQMEYRKQNGFCSCVCLTHLLLTHLPLTHLTSGLKPLHFLPLLQDLPSSPPPLLLFLCLPLQKHQNSVKWSFPGNLLRTWFRKRSGIQTAGVATELQIAITIISISDSYINND